MLRNHPLLVGLAVVALGLFSSATVTPAQNAAAKQEMKVLAGHWVSERDDGADRLTLSADGKYKMAELSAVVGWKETSNGTFTVDPTKNPKAMNFGKVQYIYEIQGDKLRLGSFLHPESEKKRPASFSDQGIIIETYSKSK